MHESAQNKLMQGIVELATATVVTLGPEGKTVITHDKDGRPYITKDGVSVIRGIKFKDPVKNIGATLIKEVAENTVKEAGDGTTTAILLATKILTEGYKERYKRTSWFSGKYERAPYNIILEDLNKFESVVLKELDKQTRKLTKNKIRSVARIAANNDEEIGRLIETAFRYSDNIKLEYGNLDIDTFELIDGMQLKTGLFDNAFINNQNKQSIEYGESKLIIVEGPLDDLKGINKIVQNLEPETPFIIMAEDFSKQVIRILRDNYNRGALIVGLVKSPGYAEHRKNLLEDIKLATGAKQIIPGLHLGDIYGIKSTKDRTIISYAKCSELTKYLKSLKEAVKLIKEDYSKELMQQRINNLEGKIFNIYVGGNSELEMKERYDRIEDAILATKCALEEGIVDGGGVALMKIYLSGVLKDNIFEHVLEAPYQKIRENGAEVVVGDNIKVGIIDPVKVVKVALKNAISVSKTILNTAAVIPNNSIWN